MVPLSYLSVIMVQYPGLPARSQPSWTQYNYLPLVAIAAIVLVLIASCGDGDAPVGPRHGSTRGALVSVIFKECPSESALTRPHRSTTRGPTMTSPSSMERHDTTSMLCLGVRSKRRALTLGAPRLQCLHHRRPRLLPTPAELHSRTECSVNSQ